MNTDWLTIQPEEVKIDSLASGHDALGSVQIKIADTMASLRAASGNAEWNTLNDQHYHLVQVKKAIQRQMKKYVGGVNGSKG